MTVDQLNPDSVLHGPVLPELIGVCAGQPPSSDPIQSLAGTIGHDGVANDQPRMASWKPPAA